MNEEYNKLIDKLINEFITSNVNLYRHQLKLLIKGIITMDNKTIEKNNTRQFRPCKNDCDYIHDYTMIELSSYYFQ